MTEFLDTPAEEAAQAPVDESAEPIFIRKLDRLETTTRSNPNGA